MLVLTFLLAALAGVPAAWLLPGTGDPQELREARIRQGLLAGSVAGAACGLLLTYFFAVAVFMMVIGPLFGALGAAVAADHPRRPRPAVPGPPPLPAGCVHHRRPRGRRPPRGRPGRLILDNIQDTSESDDEVTV